MARSPLFGRRIHIAGSIPSKEEEEKYASAEEVGHARQLVEVLVKELLRKGANFVIPVDAEKSRKSDGLPICFDWLVWDTIQKNLASRPTGAPNPLIIAVKHHKNEEQIPEQYQHLWDTLASISRIESAVHWNMNSRMEVQALWRYSDRDWRRGCYFSQPVSRCWQTRYSFESQTLSTHTGAQRIQVAYQAAMHGDFQTESGISPHTWINRIDFPNRKDATERARHDCSLET